MKLLPVGHSLKVTESKGAGAASWSSRLSVCAQLLGQITPHLWACWAATGLCGSSGNDVEVTSPCALSEKSLLLSSLLLNSQEMAVARTKEISEA